jgi:hypothetical protein
MRQLFPMLRYIWFKKVFGERANAIWLKKKNLKPDVDEHEVSNISKVVGPGTKKRFAILRRLWYTHTFFLAEEEDPQAWRS